MPYKTIIVSIVLGILVVVALVWAVAIATKNAEPKTCQEKAWHAQLRCQIETDQPCVEVFDQHLKVCREEQ